MRIAVAQPPCVPYDLAANAATHAATARAAAARVVVFPELSLTGYELDAPTVDPDDPRLAPLVAACAETGSVALVGAPVAGTAGRVHIATLAVTGAGGSVAYRKQWLGSSEAVRFSPGDRPAVLDVDGWRLGLAICRDTGIAQHVADTVALGIDVYVAGTLMFPEEAEIQDDRARRTATGHRIRVAVASFAGPTGDGYTRSAGRSGIWAPDGTLLAQAGPATGEVVSAVLDRRVAAG
ncbi:carbon-nitrogen hydrolase family protein [Micromonospora echinofusca]|uniref:Carbon-nitrogen hydrolase family protein n=1 Tax=Micromonospora echinofusca TaxID=47858 RepID=A0ABS3W087_MICEH|nr:carbon-nitrogen hydrolase family protein [Micromonospora echinofusca]